MIFYSRDNFPVHQLNAKLLMIRETEIYNNIYGFMLLLTRPALTHNNSAKVTPLYVNSVCASHTDYHQNLVHPGTLFFLCSKHVGKTVKDMVPGRQMLFSQ